MSVGLTRRDCLALGAAGAVSACSHLGVAGSKRAAGATPGSLHALARAKGLSFGTCLGTGPSGAPQSRSHGPLRTASFDDAAVRAIAVRECGVLVPENELKWYSLRSDAVSFNFERADRLAAFAKREELALRGHALLWHHVDWFPAWVKTHDFGARPAEAAEAMLRAHVTMVCARYPEIVSWDVVNETIEDDTGEMRKTVFTKALGERVVDVMFHAAREAAPHAQLAHNDYMGWGRGSARHRAGVLKLLEGLRKRDVPIGALGLQSHLSTDTPDMDGGTIAARELDWRRFLDDATAMGLDLVITELDVRDNNTPAALPARDKAVAAVARAYLDIALGYKQTKCVMVWGLVDRYSWLQDRWPREDGLSKRCCPFYDDYRPKPLREAIAEAFRAAPLRA